jgi:hypothetical protein
VGRYWVPRYLLVPGTVATLAYCTNPDDKWGWFLKQLVEWKLAGETEVLGENLPQLHFVHHKIPHDRPGLEPRTAAVGSQWLTAKLWRSLFLVPFHGLLRLAGSWWRYLTPPPHGYVLNHNSHSFLSYLQNIDLIIFRLVVFWDLMSCRFVVRCQHIRGTHCLHPQIWSV